MTATVEHAVDGPVKLLRHPLTLSETPAAVRGAAPVAGAHTRAVLAELGYTEAEIDDLLRSGAAASSASGKGWHR